jgi:hypothetical protein
VQYEEEAYLFSLITQPGADRIDIQHAAWAITGGYTANSAAQHYVDLAAANYSTLNLAGTRSYPELTGKTTSRSFSSTPLRRLRSRHRWACSV